MPSHNARPKGGFWRQIEFIVWRQVTCGKTEQFKTIRWRGQRKTQWHKKLPSDLFVVAVSGYRFDNQANENVPCVTIAPTFTRFEQGRSVQHKRDQGFRRKRIGGGAPVFAKRLYKGFHINMICYAGTVGQKLAQRDHIVIRQTRKPRPITKPFRYGIVEAQYTFLRKRDNGRPYKGFADTRRKHARLRRHWNL